MPQPLSSSAGPRKTWSQRTIDASHAALGGGRVGWRAYLPFFGPAVIASVAYVDPGNFATNIAAGSGYGYTLLWVVVLANLVAMLFQALSAKLGIVTGQSLASNCRVHLPRWVSYALWAFSEVAAMATDVAEFVGAAIGLSLLFHVPLMAGLCLVGVATFALLAFQSGGFRTLEVVIAVFVTVIAACYLVELAIAPPDWRAAAFHAVVPRLTDAKSLTIAVGIIGATVMPHALFLHSSLTGRRVPARNESERRRLLGLSNIEVVVALGLAGFVNLAMLAMAAKVFHDGTHNGIATIEAAYLTLIPILGLAAATIFGVSLLASGLSSSIVGTMAGQVIMQDFVGFRTPLAVRRLVTMVPSFIVIALGVSPTDAIVNSQVVLSLALPVPMIALLLFTGRRDVMGTFANGRVLQSLAIAGAAVILALNGLLVAQTFGVQIPFLAPAG